MLNLEIYNDDCMNVMSKMSNDCVDLVLTDIPYGEVNEKESDSDIPIRKFNKFEADIMTFDLQEFLKEIYRVCKQSFYIFCGQTQYSEIDLFFRKLGLITRTIIWEKTNPSPVNGDKFWISGIEICCFSRKSNATWNGGVKNSVIRYPVEKSKVHPTQKNVKMFRDLIKCSSNINDIVFDPCMGVGTAGIASIQLGRKFIGSEMNKEHFEMAKRKIENEVSIKESLLFS